MTVKLDPGAERVLKHLDVPGTTNEIVERLRTEEREAFADHYGYSIDWDNPPVGALILAHSPDGNEKRGLFKMNPQQVYTRLRKLEKHGIVSRVVMPTHARGGLWFRVEQP